jgi:glycerol-3-phosphate acyltransferase PlsY
MNKFLKTILLGLIVWIIPFLSSFFVWDVKINAPSIDLAWFYALMSFTGAIGFSIAAYYQFRGVKSDSIRMGWITGLVWYVELLVLDLLFLVCLFGMTMSSYAHLLLTYLTPLVLSVAIGYIRD